MSETNTSPGGAGARRVITTGDPVTDFWMSLPDTKTLLAIAPHQQAVNRLLDVLPALEADHRVHTVFSVPDTGYRWAGVEEYLRGIGAHVVPWHQAVATPYDLVLAACRWGIAEVRSPLVLTAHGAGSLRSRIAHDPAEHDLTPAKLMRGDEVIPTRLALATDDEVRVLAGSCPRALPTAVVAGDPCFDRMLASTPLRPLYREALGASPGQRIVLGASTWSRHGLFGGDPGLFSRLMDELPPQDHLVVAVLHPFIWHGYGRRQVLAWLGEARERGLVVLPPEEGWRAGVVAADVVATDHGSVGQYAAALGVRTLMSARCSSDVRPGSTAELVARISTPLHPDRPLRPQVERALERPVDPRHAEVAARITSRPGAALTILRRELYGVLGLDEPVRALPVSPVPLPVPIG